MIKTAAAFVELAAWTEANITAFTIEQVTKAVEMVTGISRHRMKFSRRTRDYADARNLFTWYCRSLKLATYMRIGSLQGRDHSTIIDQFKAATSLLETGDKTFTDKAQRVREALLLMK